MITTYQKFLLEKNFHNLLKSSGAKKYFVKTAIINIGKLLSIHASNTTQLPYYACHCLGSFHVPATTASCCACFMKCKSVSVNASADLKECPAIQAVTG